MEVKHLTNEHNDMSLVLVPYINSQWTQWTTKFSEQAMTMTINFTIEGITYEMVLWFLKKMFDTSDWKLK